MSYQETYKDWLTWADEETKEELLRLTDKKEIEDRFYKDLEFGTAGLRGVMGAGTNRMNRYTVAKATRGFADYLKKEHPKTFSQGVVIAYDSRNHSADFAKEAARVLTSAGIPRPHFRRTRTDSCPFFCGQIFPCRGRCGRDSEPQSGRIQWIQGLWCQWRAAGAEGCRRPDGLCRSGDRSFAYRR